MRVLALPTVASLLALCTACGESTVIQDGPGASSSGPSSSSSAASGGSGGSGGSGTSVSSSGAGGSAGGSGGSSPGDWRAEAWPGGLDHIVISYADTANDRCIRIQADAPTTGTLGITLPNPWGVSIVTAWNSTTGCLDFQQTPPGPSAYADTATGTIDFVVASMAIYPCDLDVDVVVQFNNPPSWLDPSVMLKTTMLTVEGACP